MIPLAPGAPETTPDTNKARGRTRRLSRLARIAAQVLPLSLAAACLSASTAPDDATVRQKCPITLPEAAVLPATLQIQKWGSPPFLPTIVVSLNGSRQERAAIATGLNANVISPDAATRLKLTTVDGRVKIDALNLSAGAGQAEITQFRASTLELPKLAVAVADVPAILTQKPHPDAPSAWLGTPFLSAFQLTLDPASNSVTLQKPTAKIPRPKQASVAKLELRDGRPYVQVTAPGAPPFWALVDTSSPATLIPSTTADKLKLKPTSVEPISWRDGKPGKFGRAVVPKLSIGKAEWKSAKIGYITPDSSKEYDHNFAVIGMDFIDRFKVTIDFLHSQITLSPPEQPKAATAPGETP